MTWSSIFILSFLVVCRGDHGWVSGIPDCLFFSTGAFLHDIPSGEEESG